MSNDTLWEHIRADGTSTSLMDTGVYRSAARRKI
jgi:hypothetical protein